MDLETPLRDHKDCDRCPHRPVLGPIKTQGSTLIMVKAQILEYANPNVLHSVRVKI